MSSATLRVSVQGDSYLEVVERAEEEICSFLEIEEDELEKRVKYEILVEKDDDFEAEYAYKAEVIARIK